MSDFKIVKLLDPISLTLNGPSFTGAYNNGTTYNAGQSVSYNGSSYVAIATTTGNIPTNTTYWQLLASKGDNGATGPQGDAGEGVPVGGLTGQVLAKASNDDYDTEWIDVETDPPGSDTQVIFNDSGAFGADSGLVYNKTNKSLGIQSTPRAPLHVSSVTGQTINNVTVASFNTTTESLNASPTGVITGIAKFGLSTGSSYNQNTSGSGYTATGQSIDYRIYAAILVNGTYYYSGEAEELNFTDTLIDNSSFQMDITFGTAQSEQTHWVVEKQINGGGYNFQTIIQVGNVLNDQDFTSTETYSVWPNFYGFTFTDPVAPNTDSASQINIGSGNLLEAGTTYMWEIRSGISLNNLIYCEQIGLTGNSLTDTNTGQQFDLEITWTPDTGDDQVIRISTDGGSNWNYFFIGGMAGLFVYSGQSSDSSAQAAWNRDFADAEVQYSFKCFARTLAPSGGSNYVYANTATTYSYTVTSKDTYYIFKHVFTGLAADGGKILADYNDVITNGKIVTADYLDIGYDTWLDGISVTPNHYGYTGTDQVREYKIYGYNGSLLIYSVTAYTLNTSNTGGYKYYTVSWTFPSGVTTVKITRGINGAAHSSAIVLNSPTTSVIDDSLNSNWGASTTVLPNIAVPSTSRFDLSRNNIAQNTDNLSVVDTTGSGNRYPSIAFGIASDSNSDPSSTIGRIAGSSSGNKMLLGAASWDGYNSSTFGTQVFTLGAAYEFNMAKSSSVHTTIWGGNGTNPLAYFYSTGDSNSGTLYIGQNSTSFGNSSKMVIAPASGSTTALHIRRTSGFTGESILIDEAGSNRAGWGAGGRMYLNTTAVSSTTFLVIGAVTTGSQLRLAASSTSATVEGDIWNDSVQKCLSVYSNGIRQFPTNALFTQTATGTCSNTTTETTVSSTGVGTLTIPANFFVTGKTIRISAFGIVSSISSPTLQIKIKFGSTVILDTTAVNVGNHTNAGVRIFGEITCRTSGSSGTVIGQGLFHEVGVTKNEHGMVNTGTITVNTTASQAVTMTAQWGTASSSNTISITNLVMEVIS